MSTGAELTSIRTGYEELGMTPEMIANDRELDITSVKAALLQCSPKYRKDCGMIPEKEENNLDFTDNDLVLINGEIMRAALYAEDENTRLKACMYVRDDKKGRREIRAVLNAGNTFNLFQFNENIAKARENVNKMKERLLSNAVNV